MFSFQNITHSFSENVLFQNIGFCMMEGSCGVLRGPNGCGKTTLLRILAGFIEPKEGMIFLEADPIYEDLLSYQRRIHYLGHKNAVDPQLTVTQNLEFFAKMLETDVPMETIIKYFSLDGVLHKKCKHLSQGWNRRIALTRLAMKKTRVWILDEPFANLDEATIDITLKLIASFCDQGGMVVMSTHQDVDIPFGMPIEITDFNR